MCLSFITCAAGLADFNIGGFYKDPKHYVKGTFQGTRLLSEHHGKTQHNDIYGIGSDDGVNFFTLRGQWAHPEWGMLVLDASAKDGPAKMVGNWESKRSQIRWTDGNSWVRLPEPTYEPEPTTMQKHFGGFYTVKGVHNFDNGSYKGIRMVSDVGGANWDVHEDEVVIIGSDDGKHFWTAWGKLQGSLFHADFSKHGGPEKAIGSASDGKITFEDGTVWEKHSRYGRKGTGFHDRSLHPDDDEGEL